MLQTYDQAQHAFKRGGSWAIAPTDELLRTRVPRTFIGPGDLANAHGPDNNNAMFGDQLVKEFIMNNSRNASKSHPWTPK